MSVLAFIIDVIDRGTRLTGEPLPRFGTIEIGRFGGSSLIMLVTWSTFVYAPSEAAS